VPAAERENADTCTRVLGGLNERDRAGGQRDWAIVLIMARVAPRGGEVARLVLGRAAHDGIIRRCSGDAGFRSPLSASAITDSLLGPASECGAAVLVVIGVF
jgi:hypothetical protein